MRVLKFGGTSVGSPERMESLLNLIDVNQKNIVVLSAFSGVTNKLVELSQYGNSKQHEGRKTQIDKLNSFFPMNERCYSLKSKVPSRTLNLKERQNS